LGLWGYVFIGIPDVRIAVNLSCRLGLAEMARGGTVSGELKNVSLSFVSIVVKKSKQRYNVNMALTGHDTN
jgi:hypothetical protein